MIAVVLPKFFALQNLTSFTMWNTYLDAVLLSHPISALTTITNHTKMNSKPSKLQYFVISLVSLLVLRYSSSAYRSVPTQYALDVCTSIDQPNPIAALFPNNATGTLNGTIAILPIPLTLARKLIPSQYGILEHAYRSLLPSFPAGMYPAVVQAMHDHEVQAFGYKIDDFSVSSLEIPSMYYPAHGNSAQGLSSLSLIY